MKQIIKTEKLTWVDIKGPTEEDTKWLKENFNFHPLVLKEILPQLDYPKIQNFGDYLFFVLFFPFFDKTNCRTIPFELDIIVSKNHLITNHYKDIVPLKAIFDKCNLYEEEREKYAMEGSGELLHKIVQEMLLACFPKLSHIKQNIDEVEQMIFRKEYKETVAKISLIKRDIIGFERIIEPQNLVLKSLIKESELFFSPKLLPYFNNLLNLYEQVRNILETNSKTLSALDSTNQSLLSTKINEIIKVLTIFSVIVFPLTFLANLFGMNFEHLPIGSNHHDFWALLAAMALSALILLGFFKYKKWL